MASSSSTKELFLEPLPPPQERYSGLSSYFSPIAVAYDRFSRWRTSLSFANPGNVETLQKEVKNTLATNFLYDGARAELSKSLSINPLFQVQHSFHLASQTSLPSYNFGAAFAHSKLFLQGSVDHEGNVNGRCNVGWTSNHISKMQMQLSTQRAMGSVIVLEHDYQGSDYNLNLKGINPSPVDSQQGTYIVSYLQSVTKSLALGAEVLVQNGAQPEVPSFAPSYVAKYTGSRKNWIATAQLQPAGMLSATYWQKIGEKVEAAAELNIVAAPGGKREGVATLGAKYDLRMASFRAQVDSTGKVAAYLEQRFAPTFTFVVSGEIDHFKNQAKVGIGVQIESTNLTPEEMGLPPQPTYPAL